MNLPATAGRYKAGTCDAAWRAPCTWAPLWWLYLLGVLYQVFDVLPQFFYKSKSKRIFWQSYSSRSQEVTTYTDDTQVYVSMPAKDYSDAMDQLTSCITNIRDWMARNRLKLNEDKSGYLAWGHDNNSTRSPCHCWRCQTPSFHFLLRSMTWTVSWPWPMWSGFCAQQILPLIHTAAQDDKQSLLPRATRTLIHAFIWSRLDNCNSMLASVSSQLLQKLQVVQNAAGSSHYRS